LPVEQRSLCIQYLQKVVARNTDPVTALDNAGWIPPLQGIVDCSWGDCGGAQAGQVD